MRHVRHGTVEEGINKSHLCVCQATCSGVAAGAQILLWGSSWGPNPAHRLSLPLLLVSLAMATSVDKDGYRHHAANRRRGKSLQILEDAIAMERHWINIGERMSNN